MNRVASHGLPRGWLRVRGPVAAVWHYYNSGRDPFSPLLSLCGERAATRGVSLHAWRDTNDRSCSVCLRRLCQWSRPW